MRLVWHGVVGVAWLEPHIEALIFHLHHTRPLLAPPTNPQESNEAPPRKGTAAKPSSSATSSVTSPLGKVSGEHAVFTASAQETGNRAEEEKREHRRRSEADRLLAGEHDHIILYNYNTLIYEYIYLVNVISYLHSFSKLFQSFQSLLFIIIVIWNGRQEGSGAQEGQVNYRGDCVRGQR